MEFIQKIDFYHLLLKHPTLIKFSKNHKEPIRLKMTTISGTIRIFCLIQKFKRFRFCLFVQNRPVSSKTKILGSKFYFETKFFSKNFYGIARGFTYRLVRGPTGPNRFEIFKILLVLVWSRVRKFFSVLVRIGPRFRNFSWSWFGPVPGFEIFLDSGPNWSVISKFSPVLVRVGPGFLRLPRSWSELVQDF